MTEEHTKITVVDNIMGKGKTTWAADFMAENTEKRFVYCAPYLNMFEEMNDRLSERARRGLYLPSNRGSGKLDDFNEHLRKGDSIGVTHCTELKKQADSKPKSDRALVLTREQEKAFMDTLMETERFARWRVMFTVLFGTGLRIGELCGLTWSDVDFRQGVLHVNRTLSYGKAGGERCRFIVHPPKTEAGNREIHMTAAVREALQAEYARQALSGFCPTRIDDVVGFIFWKSSGGLYQKGEPDHAIDCIRKVWNRQEEKKAAEENREPVLIPHFSCHSIRHVFITRLVESGANVKAVQYIAGHKSVLMTLDVYAASTGEGRAEAISLLEAAE